MSIDAQKKTDADRIKAVVLLGSGWAVGDVAEVLILVPGLEKRRNEVTARAFLRACREAFLNFEQ